MFTGILKKNESYYVVKKDLLTILIHQLTVVIPTDEESMIARDVMTLWLNNF
ncbi:hypothetical protein ACV56Z_00580 [Staphylococcus aureus]